MVIGPVAEPACNRRRAVITWPCEDALAAVREAIGILIEAGGGGEVECAGDPSWATSRPH